MDWKKHSFRVLALLIFSSSLGAAAPSTATDSPKPAIAVASPAAIPDDALGRGTPRSCMEGFFTAAQDEDFVQAAQYLNLAEIPQGYQAIQGPRLAHQLWFILERQAQNNFDTLSMEPQGTGKDGLPSNREHVARIEWNGGFADIDLEQVQSPDGLAIWKISSRTVAHIPKLYDRYRLRVADQFFSEKTIDSLLRSRLLGLGGVTWVVLALIVVLWVISTSISLLVARFFVRRLKPGLPARLLRTIYVPVILLLITTAFRFLVPPRLISTEITAFFRAQTMLIVVIVWILFRFSDFISDQVRARWQKAGNTGFHLIDLLRRISKVILVIIGLVVWLDNMGYRVTTLLASLGIIGLAVGLASQKFIEDLIAAMTLHATGVVKRDESIRFGDQQGVVVDIGLRMTVIRSRDRSLITLPNATFAAMQIQNMGRRDKFLFESQLGLRYETTPDQLRFVLIELRKLLYAHPKVVDTDARVRFVGFGASTLDIAIFCYISETLLPDYLVVAEDLNLRIMDIVAQAGASFAFPSQTLYLGRDQGIDETSSHRAEEEVRQWREQGQLFVHQFPEEKIKELSGTLDYREGERPK